MGGNQSKMPIEHEKLVIERLRAFQLEDTEQVESDYVHIDEKAIGGTTLRRSQSTTLSISEVEHWEHELLQDPKNKLGVFVYMAPKSATDSL
jgi:bleomycin hydrolase